MAPQDADSIVAERVVRNEAAFREANEDISDTAYGLGIETRVPFLCECGDGGCTAFIRLTRDEYEYVRARPNRFIIVRGHETESGSETPIARDWGESVVIEKDGRAGRLAGRLDRRNRDDDQ